METPGCGTIDSSYPTFSVWTGRVPFAKQSFAAVSEALALMANDRQLWTNPCDFKAILRTYLHVVAELTCKTFERTVYTVHGDVFQDLGRRARSNHESVVSVNEYVLNRKQRNPACSQPSSKPQETSAACYAIGAVNWRSSPELSVL